jgi:hypothetical protein
MLHRSDTLKNCLFKNMEMINAENCGKVLMMKWLGLKYSGN